MKNARYPNFAIAIYLIWTACLIWFTALCPFPVNSQDSAIDQSQAIAYLNIAHEAYQRGDVQKALLYINQANGIAPDDSRVSELFELVRQAARKEGERHLLEGERLLELGEYKAALRLYKKAQHLIPDDPRLQEQLQVALTEGKLKRIREGLPSTLPGQVEQTESVTEGSTGSGGVPTISATRRVAPSQALIHDKFKQGMKYYEMKDWFRAMKKFDEVLQLDSSHMKARMMLLELQVTSEKRDPYTRGREELKKHHYESALVHFKEVEKLEPDFLDITFLMGICLDELGDRRQAIKYYLRYLQKTPGHVDCRKNLALIYFHGGETRKAIRMMFTIKKLDPGLFEHTLKDKYRICYLKLYWFVYLLILLELVTIALLGFFIAIFIMPLSADEPYRLLRKAVKLYHTNKLDRAAKLLQRAIVLQPNLKEAHFALGLVFSKMKRLSLAVERLKTVLFLDPDDQVARYNLALIYDSMKRHDQALIELRSIISTSILRSLMQIDFREIKKDAHLYTYVFEKLKDLAQQKIVSEKKMKETTFTPDALSAVPARP